MKRKTCPCGAVFTAAHGNRRYCGRDCPARRPRSRRPVSVVAGPPRACVLCGTTFQPRQPNHIYCTEVCTERARRPEEQALYGADHKRHRRAWVPLVATGRVVCSWPGCGRLIEPGEPWDLGHWPPPSRPQHASCNRKTGGRRREVSREW